LTADRQTPIFLTEEECAALLALVRREPESKTITALWNKLAIVHARLEGFHQ
jgi:hypothetical protein